MPALLKKPKIHIILHLAESIRDYGPCSAFSAERYCCVLYIQYLTVIFGTYRFESFNSMVRGYNVFGNRLAPSRDIAVRFSTLQHLRYICNDGTHSTERYKICMHF